MPAVGLGAFYGPTGRLGREDYPGRQRRARPRIVAVAMRSIGEKDDRPDESGARPGHLVVTHALNGRIHALLWTLLPNFAD
jgi:hypothetical protein